MPKVHFHVIDNNHRLAYACRLIEHAYQNKLRVYINASNEEEAHAMDELLWTYEETSFLPHSLVGEGMEFPPPIQIGYNHAPKHNKDILLNLCAEIPAFYQQFSAVYEIVSPETQEQCREHYRTYRTQGCPINTHKPTTARN